MDGENKTERKNETSAEFHPHQDVAKASFYGPEALHKIQNDLYKYFYLTSFYFFSTSFPLNRRNKQINAMNSTFLSQNINNARLLGMSEFNSSNTLQNSVYLWTFSKANRFANGKYMKTLTDSIYSLPDIKNLRSTTLGRGSRKDFRPKFGSCSPPPNAYNLRSSFDIHLSQRKGVPLLEKVPSRAASTMHFPGPGTYSVGTQSLVKDIPIILKSRIMYYYDEDIQKKKHCVSPQKYFPSTKIEQSWRFTNISFGKGIRASNELAGAKKNPGPGTYNLSSAFDFSRKYKEPLN